MTQNPLIEKLVQNALNRCKERVIRTQKKEGGVVNGARVPPDQAGPGSFTGPLKRSRGL